MKTTLPADLSALVNALALSTLFGATVYQMQVVVPVLAHHLPNSVQAFAGNPIFPANFWMAVPTRLMEVTPFVALAMNWRTQRRKWLIAGATLMLLAGLVMPLFFLPRMQDIGLLPPRTPTSDLNRLTKATQEWLIADQLRFWLLIFPCTLAALKALATPAKEG